MNKGNVKGEWQHSVSVFLKPNYIPCMVELKQTQGKESALQLRRQADTKPFMRMWWKMPPHCFENPLCTHLWMSPPTAWLLQRWKKVCNSCQVEPEQPFCWSSAISEVGPVGRCPNYVLIVKKTFLVKSQTLLEACLRLCPKYKKLR